MPLDVNCLRYRGQFNYEIRLGHSQRVRAKLQYLYSVRTLETPHWRTHTYTRCERVSKTCESKKSVRLGA